jgi:hypothetical protein
MTSEKGLGFATEMSSISEFDFSEEMNLKYFLRPNSLVAEGNRKGRQKDIHRSKTSPKEP